MDCPVLRHTLRHIFGRQHACRESIVQIGGVVGHFVRQIDQLRLQRRAQSGKIGVQFGTFSRAKVARMLDHALAHLEGQVQSREAGVALLETLHNPQRVQIVVEGVAETLHLPVELFFAGVRERRMADIVSQGQRFGQSLVQLQYVGQRTCDLRHLDGVGKAVAKVV